MIKMKLCDEVKWKLGTPEEKKDEQMKSKILMNLQNKELIIWMNRIRCEPCDVSDGGSDEMADEAWNSEKKDGITWDQSIFIMNNSEGRDQIT